jgi:hypothetical protein
MYLSHLHLNQIPAMEPLNIHPLSPCTSGTSNLVSKCSFEHSYVYFLLMKITFLLLFRYQSTFLIGLCPIVTSAGTPHSPCLQGSLVWLFSSNTRL